MPSLTVALTPGLKAALRASYDSRQNGQAHDSAPRRAPALGMTTERYRELCGVGRFRGRQPDVAPLSEFLVVIGDHRA